MEWVRCVILFIKDMPCADCGKKYPPCAMDFDHVRGTKKISVSGGYVYVGMPALEKELAKCDLVCANCHRIRTWKRATSMRRSAASPPSASHQDPTCPPTES